MTSLFFLILSNFITCSYARNFTVFELLKKPLVFKGVRQETFFVFSVPKGIPVDETVLVIDSCFKSKFKDLALKKGVKEKDKNNDYVVIDVQALETLIDFNQRINFESCSLVYSPWYRFVSEPFRIGDVDSIYDHILGVFSYALRLKNISSDLPRVGISQTTLLLESEYSGFDKISLHHGSKLDRIQVEGPGGCSILDLDKKKILLCKSHNLLLFSALEELENGSLKNIRINKNNSTIGLAYEK